MQEIGGYFEIEKIGNKEYHKKCIKLNSARNALRLIIKSRKIKMILLPHFICDVIIKACKEEKIEIIFYDIDEKLEPIIKNYKQMKDLYVYIINYYGIYNNTKIKKFKKEYCNLIIDNTHSFFQKPVKGIDSIYNCRKYFGVPDGAYLYTNKKIDLLKYKKDRNSANKVSYLYGRLDYNASKYYDNFKKADKSFDNEEISFMSKSTIRTLESLPYKKIKKKRIKNYLYLKKFLKKSNLLKINNNKLTFMYPLLCENSEKIRKKLINNKIYVPILWPNVLEFCEEKSLEYFFAKNIIPIPMDQRYSKKEMKIIVKVIRK